jgi:hypothetical protein
MTLKVKLLPRATFRGRITSSFPASVIGIPPIEITSVGTGFEISIDLDALQLLLLTEAVVTLTDVAMPTEVALDAALGNMFYLGAAGDRQIGVPSNAPAAGRTQKLIIRHEALGGVSRTLALNTAGAGSFRFGTFVTALTATLAGTVDYIGAIYNAPDDRWDVVSYSKGF